MTSQERDLLDARARELEIIRKENSGTITPQAVVAYAEDETTALHSAFTWDDKVASREYRLWEARKVIRLCVTVHEELEEPIRTYVSLIEDRGHDGYRLLQDVLSDKQMRARLLQQALAELRRWEAKYQQLTSLAPIFEAAARVRTRTRKRGKRKQKVLV